MTAMEARVRRNAGNGGMAGQGRGGRGRAARWCGLLPGGRNWIHLQDGSGDATKGTNDITVTSMDGVAMGATVKITGTVHINKDFGAGYSYAIIVEDAKVAKP